MKQVQSAECKVESKNGPRYVAAARELRDRWLEEVNSGRLLAGPGAGMGADDHGKYDVTRALSPPVVEPVSFESQSVKQLPIAA
ncbi:MAG: hypothetical protein WD042_17615 [Phycisphaeraceae bacterium]